MPKIKVPISDETLRLWLAEQIEEYVRDTNLSLFKPKNASDDWLNFARWLRRRNELASH